MTAREHVERAMEVLRRPTALDVGEDAVAPAAVAHALTAIALVLVDAQEDLSA